MMVRMSGRAVVRVGLLGRTRAGACPNLLQRRSGPGSAAEESAEYQRFSSSAPVRSGPLQQIWTNSAAAGSDGDHSRCPDVHFALESAVPAVVLECKMHHSRAKCTSRRAEDRRSRPRKVIRRASGRISGRRYCEGCSGSGSERVPRVWCEVLSRELGRGAGRDGPPGSPPGVPGGVGRGGIGGPVVGGGPGGAVPAPPFPLRPDGASRMVGRRLACRDAAGPLGPLACGWTTCVPLDHRIS